MNECDYLLWASSMIGADEFLPLHLHPAGFIECFENLGASSSLMLKAANISIPDKLHGYERIRVWQLGALLCSGMSQCNDPDIGFRIGAMFPWCYYGELAGVIETSPSLREAGAAFRRYAAIAYPYLKSFLANINFYFEDATRLVVPITPLHDDSVTENLRRFDLDFRTAITCRLANSCGNRQASRGLVLRLQRKRPLPDALVRMLGADDVAYGASENSISDVYGFFESEWRNSRRQLFNRVIIRCENTYQAAGLSDSVTDAVRWHVDSRFIRNVELEPIAEVLGMSARSLSRKLAMEGTCFRDLVLQARINLALRHVVYSRLSIDDMARLMGFSTSSSFMRAVKAWTGYTVKELRFLSVTDAEQVIQNARASVNNISGIVTTTLQSGARRRAGIR